MRFVAQSVFPYGDSSRQILHPFYLFQVFSIFVWCAEEYYYYAACILVISGVSSVIALLETKKVHLVDVISLMMLQNMNRLREMAKLHCDVRVFRNNNWRIVDSQDLVPGDVYEISRNITVFPCDSLLLSGDALVNESMLTGESVPVAKAAVHEADIARLDEMGEINSKFYLFGGTKIIRVRPPATVTEDDASGVALGLVVRTGFNTVKGGLIRTMMFPKPNQFKFYQDSFRFIGILGIIGMGM